MSDLVFFFLCFAIIFFVCVYSIFELWSYISNKREKK